MDRSETFHHIPQIVIESGQGFIGDPVRNAEQGFGDPAGDAGERIGIAADGDGIANGVLETSGLQRTDDGWRHRPPAGDIERVLRPDTVHVLTEGVFEPLLTGLSDLVAVSPLEGQPDRHGDRLSPGDSFRMVVGHDGGSLGQEHRRFDFHDSVGDWTDPHGRSITPATVWPHAVGEGPAEKHASVPNLWIAMNPGPKMVGEVAGGKEAVCYRYGAYGVIGERCPFCEQREVLRLDVVVFVD